MAAAWTRSGDIELLTDMSGREASIIRRDGSLIRTTRRDSVLSATRDSSVLLFAELRDGSSFVVATDRRRANARRLTGNGWAEQPTISPDGRTIAFERRQTAHDDIPRSEIVTMAVDGSRQTVNAVGTDPS